MNGTVGLPAAAADSFRFETIEQLLAETARAGRHELLEQWLADSTRTLAQLAESVPPRHRRDSERILRACQAADRLFQALADDLFRQS